MEEGRQANKAVTARSQFGMGGSAAPSVPTIQPPPVSASTPGNPIYRGEEESIKTLTGPSDGLPAVGSYAKPQKWGYTSPVGNRIEVDDTPGAERISLQHHTGSSVVIDPDGSVYLVSSSRKGAGISSPYGDMFVTAAGEMVVEGANLSIVSKGDLTISVAGHLTIAAKSFQVKTDVYDEIIDGSKTSSITDDVSTVIGGIERTTVAGDRRVQVSGSNITDVGADDSTRVSGNSSTLVQGTLVSASKGDLSVASEAKSTVTGGSSVNVVAPAHNVVAPTTNMTGDLQVTSDIDAGGEVKSVGIMGSNAQLIAPVHPTGSPGAQSPAGSGATGFSGEIEKAKVMDAPDIVDELTSERKYPYYPGNAKYDSSSHGSAMTVNDDQVPQAQEVYDEYSSLNKGNLNPATPSDEIVNIDPLVGDNTSEASSAPYAVPARGESGAKISRYFTLGDLINAKSSYSIPQSKWNEVVSQHINVAYNVLDPIKQQFPDMIITSAYRPNSKNHITGRAIDIVVPSRSMYIHAEIAKFAAEKTPCEKVLLEKNDTGRSHVHVQVTPSGGKVKPKVYTCGDARCRSLVAGISVQYLKQKGTIESL